MNELDDPMSIADSSSAAVVLGFADGSGRNRRLIVSYGARDSRCCYEQNAPQAIHWAVIGGDAAVVVRELTSVLRASVAEAALLDAMADVRAVIERFERCHAIYPDDVKPIWSDERLWEMRIDIATYALLIRIYETEIQELPGHIVALRAHVKAVSGNEEEIRAAQDQEIAVAGARWDDGRPMFWGVR